MFDFIKKFFTRKDKAQVADEIEHTPIIYDCMPPDEKQGCCGKCNGDCSQRRKDEA